MAFLPKILLLVSSFSAVYAAPVTESNFSTCAASGWVAAGPYQLLADLWGASGASGSQCVNLTYFRGNDVVWSTSWNWTGKDVKSFANIQLNSGVGKKLSAISSMPSAWEWSLSSSNTAVYHVAYDLYTSSSPTGSKMHEVMMWLANYETEPHSYNYAANGHAIAIATDIKIAGNTWNLYHGKHNWQVWTFIPSNGGIVADFAGNINLFLKYLTSYGYIHSDQYLTTAQAGIEATRGDADFTCSLYYLQIE